MGFNLGWLPGSFLLLNFFNLLFLVECPYSGPLIETDLDLCVKADIGRVVNDHKYQSSRKLLQQLMTSIALGQSGLVTL